MPDFSNPTSLIITAALAVVVLSLIVTMCVVLAKKKRVKSGGDVFVRVYSSITLVLFFVLLFSEVMLWVPKFAPDFPLYIDAAGAEVAFGSFKFTLFSAAVWTALDTILIAAIIGAGFVFSIVLLIVDCVFARKETALEASLREAQKESKKPKAEKPSKVKAEKVKKQKADKKTVAETPESDPVAAEKTQAEFDNAYADLTASLSSESLGKVGLWNLDEEKPEAESSDSFAQFEESPKEDSVTDTFTSIEESFQTDETTDAFAPVEDVDFIDTDAAEKPQDFDLQDEVELTPQKSEEPEPEDVQKFMNPRTSEISEDGAKVIEELELNPIKSTELVARKTVKVDEILENAAFVDAADDTLEQAEDSFGDLDEERADGETEEESSNDESEFDDGIIEVENQVEENEFINDSQDIEDTQAFIAQDVVSEDEPDEFAPQEEDAFVEESVAQQKIEDAQPVKPQDSAPSKHESEKSAPPRADVPEAESAELYEKINEFLNKFVREGPRVVVVNNNKDKRAELTAPKATKAAKPEAAAKAPAKTKTAAAAKPEPKKKTKKTASKKTAAKAKPSEKTEEPKPVQTEVIHVQPESVIPVAEEVKTREERGTRVQGQKPERVQTVKAERVTEKQKPTPHVKPNLPLTRRYVILDRTSAANVFGEYLKEKEKDDKVIPLK